MTMDYYYCCPGNSSSSSASTTSTNHNVMNQNNNNKEKRNKAGRKKCSTSNNSGGGGCKGMMKLSTDPQSVAARERRHRISERFKILQSLVPGGNKMDTVSMLEEAIHYVKFLKTQIWLHQTIMMMNHYCNINIEDHQPHQDDDINVAIQDPPSDVDHDLHLLAASITGSPPNNNQYSLYNPSNLHDDHQVVVVPPPAQPDESTALVQPCTGIGFDQDIDETMWLIHHHDDHQFSIDYC